MLAPLSTEILNELRIALRQIYGDNLRGVYLYGSYARAAAGPESDLDVLIVLRDFQDYWQEINRTGPVIAHLSLQYGITISPVRIREAAWQHEDSPFLNTIRRECIAA